MNLFRRAFLYITRKKSKSLLLFLIIFGISTLVLCGLAALDAEAKKSTELRGTTGSGFTLKTKEKWGEELSDGSRNAEWEPIKNQLIEKIMGIDDIKSFNASQHGTMVLYDDNDNIYKNDFNNKDDTNLWYMNTFQGNYCTSTEYSSLFLTRKLELVEGHHITESDKNVIIIGKKLADKLGLKVGDKVNGLVNPENNDPSVPLTIIGLFDVLIDEEDPSNKMDNMTLDDLYGGYSYYWFVDMAPMDTMLKNYIDNEEQLKEGYQSVDFFVTDPKNLEQVIQNVQNNLGIDWDDFEIIANDEVYERVGNSMSDMSFLIRTMMIVIVVISVAIVTLILSVWVKSRMRETGILLAAGISKISILCQHILEVILLALCSFPLAFGCSQMIAGSIGDLFGKTGVVVTLNHFLWVCGFGIILLIVAILVSCISTIRQKPKEILSKMS